jgi:hypothetical protein
MSETATDQVLDYAPAPKAAFAPASKERAYDVERVERQEAAFSQPANDPGLLLAGFAAGQEPAAMRFVRHFECYVQRIAVAILRRPGLDIVIDLRRVRIQLRGRQGRLFTRRSAPCDL